MKRLVDWELLLRAQLAELHGRAFQLADADNSKELTLKEALVLENQLAPTLGVPFDEARSAWHYGQIAFCHHGKVNYTAYVDAQMAEAPPHCADP